MAVLTLAQWLLSARCVGLLDVTQLVDEALLMASNLLLTQFEFFAVHVVFFQELLNPLCLLGRLAFELSNIFLFLLQGTYVLLPRLCEHLLISIQMLLKPVCLFRALVKA